MRPESFQRKADKRGGLKAAGKRQESATFLQRSFFDVAVQFFVCCSAAFGPNDFRTAEKTMLQCSSCSAALRKLQCNFRFRLWHVAGVGFRGVRFRTDACSVAPYCAIPRDYLSDTPLLWGSWCLNMANWVRYPLPLL